MNWEAIGAIGEVFGAAGVIITLAYLAVQMRQNTRSVQRSTYQELVASSVQNSVAFANDEGLAELWAKGALDYSSLSRPEQLRFGSYAYGVLRSYENLFYQFEQGALEAELWQGFHNMLARDLKAPGLAEWWNSQRNVFNSKFQQHVEELR